MLPASPLVSVVILNYNGRRFTDTLFESLRRTTYPHVEWVMVDNASSDDSVSYTREKFPWVRIIETGANLGYTGGNNVGILQSKGAYVVLLNNDVEADPDWLTHLVNAAEADASIAALQPKLQSMINKGFFEYAGASGGFIDPWGYPFLRGRIFDTIEKDHGQYDDVRDIFWASGAALFLRRSALDEIGLLDEDFFMHFEEIDLCWRLHWAGYRIQVIPQSRIYHYVSASLPAANLRKLYWNHRNSLVVLIKNLPRRSFWRTLLFRFVLDGIAAIQSLFRGEPLRMWAVLKAHFWIYAHCISLSSKRKFAKNLHKTDETSFAHLIYPRSIVADYFLKKKREFHTMGF
ncbi:MAG TPA: glycosyltransferase family 2 protein [bacterium]|nr:glycosyltransferase family 2 protein [bacterium]HMW35198.1 glycosyltransferase family 2 protein [bacterium]HMY35038.1 glycosyltransferase family 2 protein [bacterium]HMZ04371.1 glycosyltransferase family 2 protein [bacterium]HNC48300.1 glycosyltransferase family 2 protein [bacterium]